MKGLGEAFGEGLAAERSELASRSSWSIDAWADRFRWLEEQIAASEVKRAAVEGPARDAAWLELERLRGRLMCVAMEGQRLEVCRP